MSRSGELDPSLELFKVVRPSAELLEGEVVELSLAFLQFTKNSFLIVTMINNLAYLNRQLVPSLQAND